VPSKNEEGGGARFAGSGGKVKDWKGENPAPWESHGCCSPRNGAGRGSTAGKTSITPEKYENRSGGAQKNPAQNKKRKIAISGKGLTQRKDTARFQVRGKNKLIQIKTRRAFCPRR